MSLDANWDQFLDGVERLLTLMVTHKGGWILIGIVVWLLVILTIRMARKRG